MARNGRGQPKAQSIWTGCPNPKCKRWEWDAAVGLTCKSCGTEMPKKTASSRPTPGEAYGGAARKAPTDKNFKDKDKDKYTTTKPSPDQLLKDMAEVDGEESDVVVALKQQVEADRQAKIYAAPQ